ncbi:MAG: acyltransferase family protein [Steroidobacteraceae bacterium]
MAAPKYLSYRPDIDGLRAIAVLMVVAYHAGVPGFPGGFVGVDVFFVISGFLITGLLLGELQATGTIAFGKFYARRIRRLLPAFALVLAITMLLGAIVLLPVAGEPQDLSKYSLAAVLSAANILLWIGTNYFSVTSDLVPLLHTWSLSVEEQYYMVWPAVLLGLMLLARRGVQGFTRILAIGLLLIACASFALNLYLTRIDRVAAFYLMPTRAWEFALGAGVVLAASSIARWPSAVRTLLLLTGLGALIVATTKLDASIVFPGTAVLLPTVGTAAIIAANCGSADGHLLRALTWRPLVAIGLLSYSWYLWHWPLLSLMRTIDLGQRVLWRDVAISVFALGLAALTYRYIEEPIRSQRVRFFRGTRPALRTGAALAGFVMAIALGLGLAARHFNAHPTDRWQKAVARARTDMPPALWVCMQPDNVAFGSLTNDRRCSTHPGEPTRLVLWGDSHANHLFPLMQRASDDLDANVRTYSRAACPPLLGVVPFLNGVALSDCDRFNRAVIAEIERLAHSGLEGVVLSARWAAYTGRPSPDGSLNARLSYGVAPLNPMESERALQATLAATVERLEHAGLRVLIVGQVPEFRHSVPTCLLRRSLESCSMPVTQVKERRDAANRLLAQIVATHPNAHLLDPLQLFCDSALCYPVRNAVVMFFDPQHLTVTGSRSLEPQLLPDIRWMVAQRSTPQGT